MEKITESEWEKTLSDSSVNELRAVLAFSYVLYFLISKISVFIFYFCIFFGIAFYFVRFKNVSISMYVFAGVLHFITFWFSDKVLKINNGAEEIAKDIDAIKKRIQMKRLNKSNVSKADNNRQ